MEFPGRMRDHVAEACNVSKTKLANLMIGRNLIQDFKAQWAAGKLPGRDSVGACAVRDRLADAPS